MTASAGNLPGRIFMSYRRGDTAYSAAWLYDRLVSHFTGSQVFKDVDSIELGDDFVEVITAAVASCDVLLALIGDRWLAIADEGGERRLDDPSDFVRLEIEAALARNVRVIPVLVGGARMPRPEELPASLANLARRQALELSPNRFNLDTLRLLRVLDRTIAEAQQQARQDAEHVARPQQQVEQPHAQIREPPAASGETRPVPPPRLDLSAVTIDFGSLPLHSQSPERRVRLGNAGGGTLNPRAATSASWLTLRQAGDELLVTADTSAPGEYQATITVESNGGTATIRVHARVASSPGLSAAAAITPSGPVPGPPVSARPGWWQDRARAAGSPATADTARPAAENASPAQGPQAAHTGAAPTADSPPPRDSRHRRTTTPPSGDRPAREPRPSATEETSPPPRPRRIDHTPRRRLILAGVGSAVIGLAIALTIILTAQGTPPASTPPSPTLTPTPTPTTPTPSADLTIEAVSAKPETPPVPPGSTVTVLDASTRKPVVTNGVMRKNSYTKNVAAGSYLVCLHPVKGWKSVSGGTIRRGSLTCVDTSIGPAGRRAVTFSLVPSA